MTISPDFVRLNYAIPTELERTPFFNILRTPTKCIAEEVHEQLSADERADAEKWLKQQENETREAFLKEARMKQFGHVYRSELACHKKKGS